MLHTTYGALGYGLLLFYPHDWLHSSPVGPATAQSPSPVSPKSLVLRPAVAALAGPQGGTAGSAHRSWPGSEARARSRPVWSGPSCSIQRPGSESAWSRNLADFGRFSHPLVIENDWRCTKRRCRKSQKWEESWTSWILILIPLFVLDCWQHPKGIFESAPGAVAAHLLRISPTLTTGFKGVNVIPAFRVSFRSKFRRTAAFEAKAHWPTTSCGRGWLLWFRPRFVFGSGCCQSGH